MSKFLDAMKQGRTIRERHAARLFARRTIRELWIMVECLIVAVGCWALWTFRPGSPGWLLLLALWLGLKLIRLGQDNR